MGTLLASLADFKVYKKIDTTNTREDESITMLLTNSSAFIKSYCGRTFIDNFDEEVIKYVNGSGANTIYMDEYPIQDLVMEYSDDGGATYTLATEYTNYFVGEDYVSSGTDTALYNPTIKHHALKFTYTAGLEDIPEDIQQACMDLTEYYRKAEHNVKSTFGSNSVEKSNKNFGDITKLPPHILRVLDNYRTIA